MTQAWMRLTRISLSGDGPIFVPDVSRAVWIQDQIVREIQRSVLNIKQ